LVTALVGWGHVLLSLKLLIGSCIESVAKAIA